MDCECDQDPKFHKDLNERRNKSGSTCTNEVHEGDMGYYSSPRLCTFCLFGCYEQEKYGYQGTQGNS